MMYIRWFHEIDKGEIELVGGKGANLGEMVGAGLPVPPGFCLTAKAYQDFIQTSQLDSDIQSIVNNGQLDDPAEAARAAGQIRDLIESHEIPEAMSQEILEAYHQLGQELGASSDGDQPVAVRSSATAEDLPTASFAGQQDTYLNVRGNQELLDHVKRCWASLWTDRAVTYREKQGFDHQRVYLSVVVQAMIESEISGILFTANPISGAREEAIINASWGLGEAIVSGLVSPDTLTVRKTDGEILEHQIATKERMIIYGEDGGVLELDTPEERREKPALTEEQAAALARIGQQIEEHYGTPQDIEWGYLDERYYVLQSRPITTLADTPDLGQIEGEFNRSMFIEIFPDPLSPVFLSVIHHLFKSMLDFTFRKLGFKPREDIQAIGLFYNQPYFNRDYIAATFAPLSAAVREPLVESMTNPFGRHERQAATEFSLPYLRMMFRTLSFMVRFPKQLPNLLANYRAEVANAAALSLNSLSDGEIVKQIEHLVMDSARRLLDHDFLMIAVIGRTYRLLGSMLKRFYGEESDEIVSMLISGVTGNITMETNKRIWDLAQEAKSAPAVSEFLRSHEPSEALAGLHSVEGGPTFLKSVARFLDTYGHREIRMDILYPTWGEDPSPVFGFIRSYQDADETQSPRQQEKRLVEERETLTEDVLKRIRTNLSGRFLIAPFFRWILRQTQVHTRERDTMHFELTRLFPPLRRMFFELGQRWRGREMIEHRDDIFYLHLDEIAEANKTPQDLKELVAKRRREFELNQTRPWPDIIRQGEEIYAGAVESVGGSSLQGVAGSPGIVSGVARIIRGPEEFDKLLKGDILVAPLTNPVWTPLFAVAGGIVTEVGGILSHGAIVAREYGIPAVMSVRGATTQIEEGAPISVDGNKGLVLLSENGGD